MAEESNWRSPQFAERLMTLDREQLAGEFLRRNTAYVDDYKKTHAAINSGDIPSEDGLAQLARRWGLSFPTSA